MSRIERSPYRGAGNRHDFVPLYLYEGKHFYVHSYRVGLKAEDDAWRFDAFLKHRFEGHPYDRVPESLAGMTKREPGIDAGIGLQRRGSWGAAYLELMRDMSQISHGAELRLGYADKWRRGRLRLRPHAVLALRNAKLNDYYYGVTPAEATPVRAAYAPGRGIEPEAGLFGAYSLTAHWSILAGLTATRRPAGVRKSPVVDEDKAQLAWFAGLMYDFSPRFEPWRESRPLIVRVMYGASSDCDVLEIVRLNCTSTHTQDTTSIAGLEAGQPLVRRLNGWPLDLAAFLGLIRHKERGFQADFWQINAYMKAYYYGFPWSHRVRTRLALGAGLAYAQRIPLMEVRDQALRGRGSSKLLNYLDPTVDVSLGDVLGARALRDTYLGLGASHRSGIFGSSQLFGNVDGGSNYIYTYIETSF